MAARKEMFALENPITLLTGKEKNDITRQDLINVIKKKNIEKLTFHYTALDGKTKELKIPIPNRKYAEIILTEGERADGSSLFKGMVPTGKSDLYVIPQYNTAFLNPFDDTSLDFVCRFLNPKSEIADFPPDSILYKASSDLKKHTGLELWALGELEFYLMNEPENYSFPLQAQKGYHSSSPFTKNGNILNEMIRLISQITGNIKYAHSEVGSIANIESDNAEINGKSAEQFEIEFLPIPIEDMGDTLVLARWIIRNVAYRHNSVATFAPKIDDDHAGTGMHVHLALMKNGKNVLVDRNGKLNNNSKKLIGGLIHYAPSLSAFGNTVASSYLRLVPGQEAPTKVCWSKLNRSALIRVPLGWSNMDNLANKVNPQQKTKLPYKDSRQTIELRSPDGSCNSHLLLAGITLAVDWGFSHGKKALEKAKNSEVFPNGPKNQYDGMIDLPGSCVEAAERLITHREDYERNGIFPKYVIDFLAEQLKKENDRNLNKKLMSLSKEKKVIESKKVMHRDLHKN